MQAIRYLTPAQLVLRWSGSITTGTLANWRSKGIGPTYSKFGSRVRYPLSAVEQWEAANLHHANDNQENTEAIAK